MQMHKNVAQTHHQNTALAARVSAPAIIIAIIPA